MNEPTQIVEQTSGSENYGSLLRRRWRYLATIIPVSLLLAVYTAYVLPASYRASAIINLDPSSIPKEMISTTVRDMEDIPAYAQQELELVRRKVMAADKMLQVVKQIDPYPTRKDLTPEEKAQLLEQNSSVQRVDPITLKPLDQSTAFSIDYDNPSPRLAQQICAKLAELYLTYNRTNRADQASAAYDFLQTQAKDLEVSMASMEQQLARFKAKYGNSLPEMQAHNLSGIDRSQHDLENTQREILVAEDKEGQLQLQLNNLSPTLVGAVSDWRTQIAKLRSDLADAQGKYTPAHPEVKRLKHAIDDLVAQGATSMQPGAQPPDNPDYLAVRSQLQAARNQLAQLRSAEARERKDIAGYEQNLSTTPNVEREYTLLQRDYDNSRSRYEDLQTKMKNAALARTMESEARGEKFSLLQAPKVPGRVHSPNRLGIILLGMVLGCGIALGCVAGADAVDPTVRGTSDLQEIMEVTAIGAIPTLMNRRDLRVRKLRWGSAIAAFAVASVIVAATFLAKRHSL